MTPSPTAAGIFGMMRMTGYAPPAMARMLSMVSPAAMLMSTGFSARAFSTGAMPASIPAIICGLTPRNR